MAANYSVEHCSQTAQQMYNATTNKNNISKANNLFIFIIIFSITVAKYIHHSALA